MLEIVYLLLLSALFLGSTVAFGSWLARVLRLELTQLESVVVGTLLAICLLTTLFVVAVAVGGPAGYWLLIIAAIIGLRHTWMTRADGAHMLSNSKTWTKKTIALSALLIFSALSMASTVIFSGYETNGELQFQELHDNSWHLALIEELEIQIPPRHPSYPSIHLQNYHYFYDVFVASFSQVTAIPLPIIYFQFFPVVLGGLLVASAYILGRKLHSHAAGIWLVFFTAFGGSFAYLIPVFLPGQSWSESSFWVSQTFIMMLNPQVIFTAAVTLTVVFLLLQKKLSFGVWLSIIVLVATSIGFKSYAWVILMVLVGSYLLFELIRSRTIRGVWIGGVLALASLPFVWLITGFKTGTFFYQPLWYLDTMVESPDRLNYIEWKFLEDHYRSKQNWPRVWEIKLKELGIFYAGNLGTRILFTVLILPRYFKRLPLRARLVLLAVAAAFLFSSIFPLLFLQTGIVWNSIQFWYYALIFANIGAAVGLASLLNGKHWLLKISLTVVVLGATLPTYWDAITDKLRTFQTISTTQVQLLSSLQPDTVTAVCPDSGYVYHTMLLPAYSDTTAYLLMPVQLKLVEDDLSMVEEYEAIFKTKDSNSLRNLISDQDIDYLLCTDQNASDFIADTLGERPFELTTANSWSLYQLN